MSIDENNEKIFRFGTKEKQMAMLMLEVEKIEKEIKENDRLQSELFMQRMNLDDKKEILENHLERLQRCEKYSSQQKLYNLNRKELIEILDNFLQYKDYFENPPKEAYEMDDWDYTLCREAKELEQLLYKYEIYDTKYPDKLEIMKIKYDKESPAELSREKLKLDEIFVVLTWLHRAERWGGGIFNEAIEEKTFYHLLKRMEEIRNEL